MKTDLVGAINRKIIKPFQILKKKKTDRKIILKKKKEEDSETERRERRRERRRASCMGYKTFTQKRFSD